MTCRIDELKNKQVVCVKDGSVLGYISDIDLNTETGSLVAIIIYGKPRLLGVLGREEDIVIPWSEIEVIGDETVLVNTDSSLFLKYLKPK
ncbi:MAG: YlmC/YmxH family sporulation protein [Oscillospiraceae bacterium]|nr:YlmC/YmxH family sporulation protein [Oscillospiraceae bacterium]